MSQNAYIYIAVLASSFITPFMGSSINVAIPAIAQDFGVPPMDLSWAVTAFLLGAACSLLPVGRLADIHGRKKLFRIGTGLVCLLTMACGLAVNDLVFDVLRFLQGAAMAMIFSTGTAILVASHPPGERGRVMGYSATATYSGLSLGPFLGGFITQYLGWRMLFLLTAAALTGAYLVSYRIAGEWHGAKGERLDLGGSVLYALGALALLFGISSYGSQEAAPACLGVGAVLLAAFLWRQKGAAEPLLDLSLFRNVAFAMSNLAALLHYSATFATGFLLSLYLQLLRGQDAVTAGGILLMQPVMMALLSSAAGRLSDKVQPRIVASFGMGVTAAGIFSLSYLSASTPLWSVGASLMAIGVGVAFFSSPNGNAIMGSVPPRQYGIASSVLSVTRIFGQAMSMAVVTLLLAVLVLPTGQAGYEDSLLAGLEQIFQLLAMISCTGVVFSLLRGRSGKDG